MLQQNVAPQPKPRQTRILPTCGTSLSFDAVQDKAVHSAAAGLWNPLSTSLNTLRDLREHSSYRATGMLLWERTRCWRGAPPASTLFSFDHKAISNPPGPMKNSHSVLAREFCGIRTIRKRQLAMSREISSPVEMCTEACVATSRCARNHFGGYLPHGEELRPRWRSSDARDDGGGGGRRRLQTSLRRGVPHDVVPRCHSAALSRIRGWSRDSCDQFAHADSQPRFRSLVASLAGTKLESIRFSRLPA